MEKSPLTGAQVFVVSKIEYLIFNLSTNPEYMFEEIINLIDDNKIADNRDIMNYLYEFLGSKGYTEYAEEFAKKYDMQSEKS
jgi:hypothetical protein